MAGILGGTNTAAASLQQYGMPSDNTTPAAEAAPAPRRRSPPRRVQVTRVQALSPAMRRITLAAESLADFPAHLPASYIKLIFPLPGQTEPPEFTPDGPRPATMRTYTPLHFDAAARSIDVDFVLHGEGPAATWAAQAAVGQPLLLMGPGPGYPLDTAAAEHWLIGDDSALPAFETILAALPATASVRVLMEVVDAREERTLPTAAQAQVQWLARGEDNAAAGQTLQNALQALGTPPGPEARIYLACEAAAMRRLRLLLIDGLGVPRKNIVGRGYWKLGTVNHPDHDYGDDA